MPASTPYPTTMLLPRPCRKDDKGVELSHCGSSEVSKSCHVTGRSHARLPTPSQTDASALPAGTQSSCITATSAIPHPVPSPPLADRTGTNIAPRMQCARRPASQRLYPVSEMVQPMADVMHLLPCPGYLQPYPIQYQHALVTDWGRQTGNNKWQTCHFKLWIS